MEWQPIETAPKGATVLLKFKDPVCLDDHDWPASVAVIHDDWIDVLGALAAWYADDKDIEGWMPIPGVT